MVKAKIAVLGGGAGSLATAFALTSQPGWDQRFEITVYQMGWRLGGKGASARTTRLRNEEHGLHVLGGFYHNALRVLRECYEEWGTFAPHALEFDETFLPHSRVHLMQDAGGSWKATALPLRENLKQLGVGATELTPWELVKALVDWISEELQQKSGTAKRAKSSGPITGFATGQLLAANQLVGSVVNAIGRTWPNNQQADQLVQVLDGLASALALRKLLSPAGAGDAFTLVLIETAIVVARGILADSLHQLGFDAANGEELRAWLYRHGATSDVANSPIVRGAYDYVFGYENGDPATPCLAAGVALRGLLRMLFTYHRAVFVHMRGGMGEVVFTALYEVLRERGVKFHFFHRIDRLGLDATLGAVDHIIGTRQAMPIGGADAYEPLIDCAGRKAWPDAPLYDQLEQCDQPPSWAEDLYESPWTAPSDAQPFVLQRGQHFDLVVLGIPVGALQSICIELAGAHLRWAQMLSSQQTVQTIAAQMWLTRTTSGLGWSKGQTLLTAFAQPLTSWADMSFLLPLEQNAPKQLSYLCGTMTRAWSGTGPPPPNYDQTERQNAEAATNDWLRNHASALWPSAIDPGVGWKPGYEVERYVRANSSPSAGYVLSRPGTIEHRMRTDKTDVANLYLAGDWIRTGMDCGAFEVAVMSGLQCSRAISGYPILIPGESDFP